MSDGHPFALQTAVLVLALLSATPGFAAHPLITEDTGTQGRNNGQLELTAEYGWDEEAGVRDGSADFAAVLAYGLRDNLDLLLTIPYSHTDSRDNGVTTTTHGIGDVGLDTKWRFFEKGILSVAVKAGATFPTGDDTDGMGAGRHNYSVNLVTSFESGPWAYHLHLGYIRNRNVHGERDVIKHASVAVAREVMDSLNLVVDLGSFTAADRAFDQDIRFLTLGAIYGVNDDFDIDIGLRHGLSKPETDTTLLLGVVFRF